MISAVMSAISRRRTPEQRGAERDGTPARLWPEILIGPGAASPSATPKRRHICDYPTRIKSIPFGWVRPIAEHGPLRYSDTRFNICSPNCSPKTAELHD
jgi:hypothetical protein